MKNILSLIACAVICIVLLQYRVSTIPADKPLNVTQWDAFGYYMYLPAVCIYHDYKKLDWLTEIDKKYGVSGGDGWQAQKEANGNYVFKYLGGVSLMQLPFFYIGHIIAKNYGYPVDGFSPPYMYALAFGIIFYCMLGLLLLRYILLRYFKDSTVAITLLLLCLATNFIQYVAVDNGLSHAYIFPLYVAVIFTTMKWHQNPRIIWAALTGYIIGLATISRPTEAVMLFIPLMWHMQTKEAGREKWRMVKTHKSHVIVAVIGGLLGILPQLIYWKLASGHFIYDVGSKWQFLTPWFRVLFGWEKGWFIYTPVTLLFVIGLFFVKRYPFRKAVLWFCLLNIYIIISWHEWRYAASYSTRALVQSYPVFALPFAAFVNEVSAKKWRWVFYIAGGYLIFLNLFQVRQYNSGVLHYDDMNRLYYSHIYLKAHPNPLDMSLMDTDEFLSGEDVYSKHVVTISGKTTLHADGGGMAVLLDTSLANSNAGAIDMWLKVESDIKVNKGMWQSYLNAELKQGDSVKHSKVRLFNAISPEGKMNRYAFYVKVPGYFYNSRLKLYLSAYTELNAEAGGVSVTVLTK